MLFPKQKKSQTKECLNFYVIEVSLEVSISCEFATAFVVFLSGNSMSFSSFVLFVGQKVF